MIEQRMIDCGELEIEFKKEKKKREIENEKKTNVH